MANHRIVEIPASNLKKSITKILFEKGYDGGPAKAEEVILTEIKNGNREILLGNYEAMKQEKVDAGEKFEGKELKEYNILKRDYNLPPAQIDVKIKGLQELQEKSYYKFLTGHFGHG